MCVEALPTKVKALEEVQPHAATINKIILKSNFL